MDKYKLNLIKRAQNGDITALSKLIKEAENLIYPTLLNLKADKKEISDITQNILIKISLKIKTLKNPNYFKTWLNRITTNTYYDFIRTNKKNEYFTESKFSDEAYDDWKNPIKEMLSKELNSIINNSINKLPAHYKIPITLREIEGMSYEDISTITNLTIGTVKSRISRARNIIKNDIKKYQNN